MALLSIASATIVTPLAIKFLTDSIISPLFTRAHAVKIKAGPGRQILTRTADICDAYRGSIKRGQNMIVEIKKMLENEMVAESRM